MPGGLEAIQLSAAMLRNQAPDLVLLERQGARGLISIGNAVLAAELPEQVRAGDKLTLLVHDASDERVVLKLVAEETAGQPQAAPPPLTLPNGARARIEGEPEGRRERGEHSLSVAYSSPALGSLGFRLALDARSLTVTVRAAPGHPVEAAEERAGELRDALARATGRAVQVTVLPREEPVDVYA
jgi:hypothetical protein